MRQASDPGDSNKRLVARVEELCTALLGEPTAASDKEFYFENFTVTVRGPRAGSWSLQWPNGSPRDKGDNLIGLIMAVHGCGVGGAFRFAVNFLAQPEAADRCGP